MNDITPTADLYDEHGEALQSCDTQFRSFGRRRSFSGPIVTVRSHEDNALLKKVVQEPGEGRVVVVDAGGSTHCAMLGDKMAEVAVASGWAGLIIHGVIRDTALVDQLDIGVKALGSNPRKSHKHGTGERDVVVAFGGAVFTPGHTVVSDDDGVVVLSAS